MKKRQYNQVCALSVGLDLIGDRWTLLILRELLFGVRRFSDILRGTPGLSTNLLSQRLRELEQAKLIEHRKLPPPAASSVYGISPKARSYLLPIIVSLTDFGVQFLKYPPEADQFVPASSTMGAMNKFFQAGGKYNGSAEFRTDHDVYGCIIEDGVLRGAGFGEQPNADLIMVGSSEIFMGLIVGYISLQDVFENEALILIRGELKDAEAFFANFVHDYTDIWLHTLTSQEDNM